MFSKLFAAAALAAVLAAASPAAARADDGDSSCAYSFDVTRSNDGAASGCPVATWHGGSYDPTMIDGTPASDGAPEPAPVNLAMLWTTP
ncbi:MAG TPA: hypothetical protein VFK90_14865 [Anaeromyxobacter sp.]|nr:hypothetical protein [Anaeromyxobacter sp.]